MRFPDWRPARDRYDVEMHSYGPTGRYLGIWKFKGVSFESALTVIQRFGERRDIRSVKLHRLPPRRRKAPWPPTRPRHGLDFLLASAPDGSVPPAHGGPPPDFED